MKKSMKQLTLDDFDTFPVWTPVDDLEDELLEVEPYHEDVLHFEWMYLVSAQIVFADQSTWNGYVRFSSGEAIVVAIATNSTQFVAISAEGIEETIADRSIFAREFNKEEDDVFPFVFRTKIKLHIENNVY